jgi:hypothetical protein
VNNNAFELGEPGYSLYIPSEFALQIYDNLMKVGRDYGIRELNIGRNHLRGQCHELDIFVESLNILISTRAFYVSAADGFQGLFKAFHFPLKFLTFYLLL